MGLSPSFVVYDELGQSDNRELYDAMDSAMGGRKEPLLLVISTQAATDVGRYGVESGHHRLVMSISAFDPKADIQGSPLITHQQPRQIGRSARLGP
jgi:hypothetical protein